MAEPFSPPNRRFDLSIGNVENRPQQLDDWSKAYHQLEKDKAELEDLENTKDDDLTVEAAKEALERHKGKDPQQISAAADTYLAIMRRTRERRMDALRKTIPAAGQKVPSPDQLFPAKDAVLQPKRQEGGIGSFLYDVIGAPSRAFRAGQADLVDNQTRADMAPAEIEATLAGNPSLRQAGVATQDQPFGPGENLQHLGHAAKAGLSAMFTTESKSPQLTSSLGNVRDWYKTQAAKYVANKFAGEKPAMLAARADEVYDKLVDADMQAADLRHPNQAQMLSEFTGDAVVPNPASEVFKGAKAAYGVAKGSELLGPAVKSLEAGVYNAAKDLRPLGYDALRNKAATGAAAEGLGDVSSLLRRGQDAGDVYGEGTRNLNDQAIAAIAAEMKKVKPEQQELAAATLHDALAGDPDALRNLSVFGIDPAVQAKVKAATDVLYARGTKTGRLQRAGESGKLELASKQENYVPERVQATVETPGAKVPRRPGDHRYGVAGGGELEKAEENVAVKNPLEQFRNAAVKDVRADKAGYEMREMNETLSKHNMVQFGEDLQTPRVAKVGKAEVKLIPLPKEMSDEWIRSTGKVGDEVKQGHVFVPEWAYQRLDQIMPKSQKAQLPKVLKDIAEYTIKPIYSIFRSTATSLGGVPFLSKFYTDNVEGAVGLGILGSGLKAANPELQAGAFKVSLLAAGLGDPAASKMAYTLENGAKIRMPDLVAMMKEDGVLGQGFLKYDRDLSRGKGPLGAVAGAMHQTQEKLRLSQFNDIVENYQHGINYLSALKGTDKLSRAQALDFAERMSGNIRRLSPFEKEVMRSVVPFYAWKRTIYPAMARTIAENPQRAAFFEHLRQGAERHFGPQFNVPAQMVPKNIELAGEATSPPFLQPSALPPNVAARTETQEGSFTMSRPETPLSVIGDYAEHGFVRDLGPGGYAFAALVLGKDPITGEDLPETNDWFPNRASSLEDIDKELKTTKAGQAIRAVAGTPIQTLIDLGRAYWDSSHKGTAIDLWTRVGIAKRTGGIDRLAAAGLRQLGFDVQGESLGYPGVTTNVVNPSSELKKNAKKAQKIRAEYWPEQAE